VFLLVGDAPCPTASRLGAPAEVSGVGGPQSSGVALGQHLGWFLRWLEVVALELVGDRLVGP
jgi:hypothetical protein